MFGKNKNVPEGETPENKKMTTDNILEMFSKDMMKEKRKEIAENLSEQDPVLYLDKATLVFKILFFITLFFSIILSAYSYIQKDEEATSLNYLNPICGFMLGKEGAQEMTTCRSLASAQLYYDEEINKIKSDQAKEIAAILEDVYALDNFLFTNDISFLLSKSSTKLPVTKMLAEFNELKEIFEPSKGVYSVDCKEININNEWEMKLTCSAYTSDWSDSNIIGFNGQVNAKKISGTSITVASSFINFIKNKSENFKVKEATNLYNYSDEVDEGKERYTRKTDFEMTLQYSNPIAK